MRVMRVMRACARAFVPLFLDMQARNVSLARSGPQAERAFSAVPGEKQRSIFVFQDSKWRAEVGC